MEPLRSIDTFIQMVESTVSAPIPLDQKIDLLRQLIAANGKLLEQCHNPALSEKFEQLSRRISKLPAENSDQMGRIESLGKSLKQSAEGFRLPPEAMNLIVKQFVQSSDDREGIWLTSKETRQQAIEAFREPLFRLGIDTADKAIAFAKEFGQRLTFVDINSIEFSETQMKELLEHLPNLKTLEAISCEMDDKVLKEQRRLRQ